MEIRRNASRLIAFRLNHANRARFSKGAPPADSLVKLRCNLNGLINQRNFKGGLKLPLVNSGNPFSPRCRVSAVATSVGCDSVRGPVRIPLLGDAVVRTVI